MGMCVAQVRVAIWEMCGRNMSQPCSGGSSWRAVAEGVMDGPNSAPHASISHALDLDLSELQTEMRGYLVQLSSSDQLFLSSKIHSFFASLN